MPKKYKYRKILTIDGRKYQIYADSEFELGQKIERKQREVEEQKRLRSGYITLREWSEICIDTYKIGLKDSSKKTFEQIVKNHILDTIGNLPLKSITPLDCQRIMNSVDGKSKTLINYVYQGMRFLFRHAVANRYIAEDPTAGLVKPKGTQGSRRALLPEERQAVIAVASGSPRYYHYLLMMLCGCRPSEATNAVGSDIQTITDFKSGETYSVLHIRGTKTKNSDRFVPIPPELLELIKDTPANMNIAHTDDGRMITGHERRRWLQFKYHLNVFLGAETYRNAVIEEAVAPGLLPYCLRHEYCTELARRGIDIRIAQKLMGHADIRMTANIYTNLDQNDVLSAAKVLAHPQGNNKGNTPGNNFSHQKSTYFGEKTGN